LSTFGDKCPQSGSKNGQTAPRTGTGYPHEGPSAVRVGGGLRRRGVLGLELGERVTETDRESARERQRERARARERE
jgi:hypothetical protein